MDVMISIKSFKSAPIYQSNHKTIEKMSQGAIMQLVAHSAKNEYYPSNQSSRLKNIRCMSNNPTSLKRESDTIKLG